MGFIYFFLCKHLGNAFISDEKLFVRYSFEKKKVYLICFHFKCIIAPEMNTLFVRHIDFWCCHLHLLLIAKTVLSFTAKNYAPATHVSLLSFYVMSRRAFRTNKNNGGCFEKKKKKKFF